jgi:16S rRNA (guanine527-N7)-methyltransferase
MPGTAPSCCELAPDARTWADLGAGAGLPGVVLAILLKDTPGAKIHLVESMAKRCKFLRAVVDDLGLPVEIHNARAEELDLKVDVVTARACAPMVRLLGYAQPYLKRGATGWFLKGQDVAVGTGGSGYILEIRVRPAALPERPARPDRASEGAQECP